MTKEELVQVLQSWDALDGRQSQDPRGYEGIAADLLQMESVRDISLYLQRLDLLDDRLADHPKYFEYLARDILGITPNPHPDEIEH